MIRLILLATCLLAAATPFAAEDRLGPPIVLIDAIERLEGAGHAFVYSSDLVDANTTIRLREDERLSIPALADALERIGLGLERDENDTYFVVQRATPAAMRSFQGRVTDALSGEPLAGVRVEIAGAVVFTDAAGRFELPNPFSPTVLVSMDGYQEREVSADAIDTLLEIPLDPHPRLEEIVVVSSRYALRRLQGESRYALDPEALNGIPELGDDALRAANHLPGTATIGLSAKPHIRGGLDDEVLVLFNDVELLEPFHLKDFQSVFSSFNPSLVQSIDVYTGGFPVRYGDRMSGVMDIQPAEDIDGFGAELMLSFLSASASAVGTTHGGRGRWALSGRRGNLDLVVDAVNPSVGDPKYSDWYGAYGFDLSEATELELGFIAYADDVLLKDLDDGDGELADSRYRNAYGWLQLHHRWSDRVWSTTSISYGSVDHDRDGFINDEDLEEGSSTLDDRRSFDLFGVAHWQFVEVSDTVAAELGARLNYQRGDYATVAEIGRGALAELVGLPLEESRNVVASPSGPSGGAYGSVRWLVTERLALEGGLRLDFQDFGGISEQYLSPRMSVRYDLTDATQVRFSAGRFYQPEQIHELEAADGLAEFQQPQHSDHYILSLGHAFGSSGWSARIEGFYKSIHDPKRRFENLFNSLVLMPEIASDRVAIAPSQARARGFEATLAFETNATTSAWLSYTNASVEDEIDGRWERRVWDQRHSVSTGIRVSPGAWTLSATVLWHSGWQTTRLPAFIPEGELPDLGRNADRLPGYVSVDLGIERTWRSANQSLTLFAEITNVLDRRNVGAYEYDVEQDEELGGYAITAEPVDLLPLVPCIGLRWTFE